MGSASVVDLIEASGVHFSGLLMDRKQQNGHTRSLMSETEKFHKQPFVIGKYFNALHAWFFFLSWSRWKMHEIDVYLRKKWHLS